MSNIDRKYKYYDEGVLPEEGEYGVTYLTLYSSNAGNIYDGWIWDPEHKTTESQTSRTFGYRHPEYPDYCYDDEVVVDLSNPQSREESEFEQGRITSFNTSVSSTPIFISDAGDVSALTEEEREAKATTVLFSAIPLIDDSYIHAEIEIQAKMNISPDNTTGRVRVEAFYILNDESDRTMRPHPIAHTSVAKDNEYDTFRFLYWNPALRHEEPNYIGVKLLVSGGTAEIGISDNPEYGDAIITLTSAGLTGDNIFSGEPLYIELSGKEEVGPGYKLDVNDYKVLAYYDTDEVYDVTRLCEFDPVMGTEITEAVTYLNAYYHNLSDMMMIFLGQVLYIELTGNEEIYGEYTLDISDYKVTAYLDNGEEWDVTDQCTFDPPMGTTLTTDTTLTATYRPFWMEGQVFTDSLDLVASGSPTSTHGDPRFGLVYKYYGYLDTIGQYGKGNIDLYDRPQYIQPDGSISTVNSVSFNEDGKEILIPTIARDQNNVPIQMTFEEAIDYYHQTGEYLGKFDNISKCNSYAEELHKQQEWYYSSNPNSYRTCVVTGEVLDWEYTPKENTLGYSKDWCDPYLCWHYGMINIASQDYSNFVTFTGNLNYYNPVYQDEYDLDVEPHPEGSYSITINSRYIAYIDPPRTCSKLIWKAKGAPIGLTVNNANELVGFDKLDTSRLMTLDSAYKNTTNELDLSWMNDKEFPELISMASCFWSSSNDLSTLETLKGAKVRNLSGFLRNNTSIDKVPDILKNIDTSELLFIPSIFSNCTNLVDLRNLSSIITYKILLMDGAFTNCVNIEDFTPLSKWKYLTKLVSARLMFYYCDKMTDTTFCKWWQCHIGDAFKMFYMRSAKPYGEYQFNSDGSEAFRSKFTKKPSTYVTPAGIDLNGKGYNYYNTNWKTLPIKAIQIYNLQSSYSEPFKLNNRKLFCTPLDDDIYLTQTWQGKLNNVKDYVDGVEYDIFNSYINTFARSLTYSATFTDPYGTESSDSMFIEYTGT